MRRLELVLSYFHTFNSSLLTGIFFLLYAFTFIVGSLIIIFLCAVGLYLFGILILTFVLIILIIGGLKMRKLNKQAKKIKKQFEELMM